MGEDFLSVVGGGETKPNTINTGGDRFTFLIAGTDEGSRTNARTDTLMVAMLDIKEYTLSVLNIPRDAYVKIYSKEFDFEDKITNVYSWACARIKNDAKKNGVTLTEDEIVEKGVGYLKGIIQYTFGIPIDFHVFIDLDGVKTLVDELGGIWFDVPFRMKYSDPYQSLYIDLQPGYQLLNGDKAEQLVRFREPNKDKNGKALSPGYGSVGSLPGAMGRLHTQQKFLAAVMKKILADFSIDTVKSLFSVGSEYMTTNLSMVDVLWFSPKITHIKPENIRFHAVPCVWLDTNGYSHDIVYKQETMAIINKYYNKSKEEIPESSFNIFDDGLKYVKESKPDYDIFNIDGVTADSFFGE